MRFHSITAKMTSLLVVIMAVLGISSCAHHSNDEEMQIGFIDRSGRMVLGPSSDYLPFHSEGLIPLRIHHHLREKYGYMDETGRIVVKPRFDWAGGFSEGLAPVQMEKKWGYVDKTGRMVIEPRFDEARWFSEGLAVVGVGRSRYITCDHYGYVDNKGSLVIKPIYKQALEFRNGVASVCVIQDRRMRWLYIDRRGHETVGGLEGRESFSEGLAPVRIGEWPNDSYGYADMSGKLVIKPRFFRAKPFSEGLAVVQVANGKYGFIDRTGKMVIPPPFFRAEDFSEGLAMVGIPKGQWGLGYVDKQGHVAIKPGEFTEAGPFKEGLAAVRPLDGKWGYIDKSGKMVIPPRYDETWGFEGGLAAVSIRPEGPSERRH